MFSCVLIYVLFQNQFFCFSKGIISGHNDQISGLQTFGYFVLLRVLSADGERDTDSLVVLHLVNPLSAGGLIEIAARHDEGIFRLAQFNLYTETFESYMMATGEMATDVGTILYGKEAVSSGLIDKLGGLNDALSALHKMIDKKKQEQ